nr:23S rRNA methyltransferase attenuation leader peptide [Klebsiella pneumoniae]UPG27892.1 23S rRNA methyltransferase attenuation leader peptide [Klebsiella pneumoniae]
MRYVDKTSTVLKQTKSD